jgi:hypothetical protein
MFLFQTIWSIFVVNCIVLINLYIGIGMTNMTAPKNHILKWQDIKQIRNSTILVNFTGEDTLKIRLEQIIEQAKTLEGPPEYSDLGADLYNGLYDCFRNEDPQVKFYSEQKMSKAYCNKIQAVLDQLVTTVSNLKKVGV